jgi:hypothetical protein
VIGQLPSPQGLLLREIFTSKRAFVKLQLLNILEQLFRGSIMGSRDIRHREAKKPKRDAKKKPVSISFEQPAEVEVIKKVRKPREEKEE